MPHAPAPTPPDAPDRLVAALRAAHAPSRELPDGLAADILSDYRASRRSRLTMRWSIAGAGLAAAAALAFAFVLYQPSNSPIPPAASRAKTLADASPEDLNADGRVDIADALALAQLADAGSPSLAHDLNADGRIDRADADLLALKVVRLDRMVLQ